MLIEWPVFILCSFHRVSTHHRRSTKNAVNVACIEKKYYRLPVKRSAWPGFYCLIPTVWWRVMGLRPAWKTSSCMPLTWSCVPLFAGTVLTEELVTLSLSLGFFFFYN